MRDLHSPLPVSWHVVRYLISLEEFGFGFGSERDDGLRI
jgi:hypothetical protein